MKMKQVIRVAGVMVAGTVVPAATGQCEKDLYVQQVIPLLTPSGIAQKVLVVEGIIWVVQSGLALKFVEHNGQWQADSTVPVPPGSMGRFDGRRRVCVVDTSVLHQSMEGGPWSTWWTFDLGVNWPSWNQLGARLTENYLSYAYSGGQDFYNWATRPIGGGEPSWGGGQPLGNQLMVSSDHVIGIARVWNGIGSFPGIGFIPMLSFVDVDISDTLSTAVFWPSSTNSAAMASTLGGSTESYARSASGNGFQPSNCAAGTSSAFALGRVGGVDGILVEFRKDPAGVIRAVQELPLGASGPMGADGDSLVAVTRSSSSSQSGRELVVLRRVGVIDCDGDGVDDCIAIGNGSVTDINHNGIPDNCECLGDIYVDQRIDGGDLGVLLANWGLVTSSAASRACDIDGNSIVNGADLGILLANWGPCSN